MTASRPCCRRARARRSGWRERDQRADRACLHPAGRRRRVDAKLARKLNVANRAFLNRWRLGRKPGGDQSKSALDMSVARMLAGMGLTADEITFLLTERFEHGVVARNGLKTPRPSAPPSGAR